MNLKNQKDFFSGVLFMATGVAFAWSASQLPLGTAAQMGPGYVPLLLGAVLALLGVVLAYKALVFETEDGGRIAPWGWRAMVGVVLAHLVLVAFLLGWPMLGLPPMGLLLAALAFTLLVVWAGHAWHHRHSPLLALVLALLCALVLVGGMRLSLPLWPVGAA